MQDIPSVSVCESQSYPVQSAHDHEMFPYLLLMLDICSTFALPRHCHLFYKSQFYLLFCIECFKVLALRAVVINIIVLYSTINNIFNRCFKRYRIGKYKVITIFNIAKSYNENSCSILRDIDIGCVYDFVLNRIPKLSQCVVNSKKCFPLSCSMRFSRFQETPLAASLHIQILQFQKTNYLEDL